MSKPSLSGEELKAQLATLLEAGGADCWGIADLSEAHPALQRDYGDFLLGLDRAVSVAAYFPREVIDQLLDGPTHTYLHYYRVVNAYLDETALKVAGWLQRQGYRNFPVPSSQRISRDRLAGLFPHRLAAYLAGLGWIGKSGSLITPAYGPSVRLVTVLTNAPLPAGQPLKGSCGECQRCVEACPAKALQGVPFYPGQELRERLQPELCDEYQNQVRSRFGKRVCGVCLAVCPWGRKNLKNGEGRSDDGKS